MNPKEHFLLTRKSIEKAAFFIVTILNLLPVLVFKFLPTMDGPAHLYNANLIGSLIFGDSTDLVRYFVLNAQVVPNWTGHFILAFFSLFLPAFLSEKIFLLIYLIGFPYAFRSVIKTINPKNIIASYLIFPFIYSFVFLLGFYNFAIGLVFLFITLKYWLRFENKMGSFKRLTILFLLLSLTYFSHIFVFSILVLTITMHIIVGSYSSLCLSENYSFKNFVLSVLRKAKWLILGGNILFVFFFVYFLQQPAAKESVYIETNILIQWLKYIRPIVVYNPIIEEAYTRKILYIFIILLIVVVFSRMNTALANNQKSLRESVNYFFKTIFTRIDVWLLMALVMLLFYFVMPDSDGQAGFVSIRLGLLFFLFFVLWISVQKLPKWIYIFAVLVVLFFHFKILKFHYAVIGELNEIAVCCNNASKNMNDNSTVLPVNFSQNWLCIHFSNYLATDKPLIIFDNYEATNNYFPVRWKDRSEVNSIINSINNKPPIEVLSYNAHLPDVDKADYVFILDILFLNADTVANKLAKEYLNGYKVIHSDNHCAVYGKKPK